MEQPKKWPLELLFVLFLSVLGVIIMAISLQYGFGTFKKPGPGLYPFFIGMAVAVFAAVLLISEWKMKDRPLLFDSGELRIFLTMLAAFCLWIVVMPPLGYVLVTLLSTLGFCKIMKLEGWWKPLAVSVGTTLFIWLLFDYWLYIDLPRGILG